MPIIVADNHTGPQFVSATRHGAPVDAARALHPRELAQARDLLVGAGDVVPGGIH